MGLSIHYQGKIKDYALIEELVQEVTDICKTMDWSYHTFEADETPEPAKPGEPVKYMPEHVKGISFSPEECEPISLTFLPDGTLVCWVKLIHNNHLTNDLMIEWVSTKTQFAGPDAHIAVVKLLHYLSEKYFSFFEMNDEGYYWGQWDESVLLAQFKKYNFILDTVCDALSNMKHIPGEPAKSLADRIEDALKKKFGEEDSSAG